MLTNNWIATERLHNLLVINNTHMSPAEVVRHMGMLQAQDYLGSLWAVGLRTPGATEASIEKALAERSFVRTWPARGTLHFVAAEDVRWFIQLLGARVISSTKGRYRQLELDEETFTKSSSALSNALRGGNQLTREEMYKSLEKAGISTDGQRGIHILGWNAMKGFICFGPRRGKQQTFVLLDEWIPQSKLLNNDQALAELARRYFTSHGPATLNDFSWWSGLTKTEAKRGIEMVEDHLIKDELDGEDYWVPESHIHRNPIADEVYLLPPFDEFLVGYTNRTAALEPEFARYINNGGGILHPAIVINGKVMGTWKRTLAKSSVTINPSWFTAPTLNQTDAFAVEARRYAAFLNLDISAA